MPSSSQCPSVNEVKAVEKTLKTQLAALRNLAGAGSTRTIEEIRGGDRERKKQERKTASVVLIPPCADRKRRERLEADDAAWLRWYCDDPCWPKKARFWYDFTSQQLDMIAAIREAIVSGGDQAIAASRGEGKTKLFERSLLKHVLSGAVSFAVLFAATGSNAEDSLDSIKNTIETGERLRADYPEVCVPVLALEGFATGFTIDYGITEIHGTKPNVDEGVDEAVYSALHERREWMMEHPYLTEGGEAIEQELTLIDSMWKRDAVFRFCDEAGLGWYPAVGYGKSSGCAAPNFREPVASNPDKMMGWHYFSAPRPDGGWLVHMNADHWKGWEHDRWMSDPEKAGALLLFGDPSANPDRLSDDQKGHHAYR